MGRLRAIEGLAGRQGGGLPGAFRYLFAATLVNRLGNFVVPFLALYLTDARGLGLGTAGSIVALYGAGAIFCQPIGGTLADRLGRRRAIFGGLVTSGLAMLHLAAARSVAHIAVAAFIVGLSDGLARPATNAAVSDLVEPKDRARAYGYLYWAANLGFAFSSFVAGFLAHARFELLFVADAATSLLAGTLVLARLPETQVSTPAKRGGFALAPFLDSRFSLLFFVSVLAAFVFVQFNTAVPLDLRAHGVWTRTYGALAGLNGLLVVLLQPLAIRFTSRVRPHTALAVGALVSGIGFGLFGFTSTISGYAFAITILTVGEVAMAGSGPAVIAEIAPASLRGTYQGAYGMSFSAAACLAPFFGTRALASLGTTPFWVLMGAVSIAAAALYVAIGRRGLEHIASEDAAPSIASA